MRRSVHATLALAVLGACSATSTSTSQPEGGGGGPGTDLDGGGQSADSSVDSAPGPGRDGATATDGAAATDGASGGDGAGPDDRLVPLAVGRTWTYEVKDVGTGSVCGPGTHPSTVLGHAVVDGRDAFQVTSFCTQVGSTNETVNGDQVDADYQGTWLHVTDVPVQAGHSWTYFNTSYTWEAVATITVPAGTFTGCWRAHQNVTYTAYQIYCRGVGVVESYSQDLAGNGWDAKLTAKNF